jgi:hypothetical protein
LALNPPITARTNTFCNDIDTTVHFMIYYLLRGNPSDLHRRLVLNGDP